MHSVRRIFTMELVLFCFEVILFLAVNGMGEIHQVLIVFLNWIKLFEVSPLYRPVCVARVLHGAHCECLLCVCIWLESELHRMFCHYTHFLCFSITMQSYL